MTVQRLQNGDVDGHYVPFEYPDLKRRYSCFVASAVAQGVAVAPGEGDDGLAPCPCRVLTGAGEAPPG